MSGDLTLRLIQGDIYGVENTQGDLPANYWIGTRCSTASIDSALAAPGLFLFLNGTPGDFARFESNLNAFTSTRSGAAVLWIDNPNDPMDLWRFKALDRSDGPGHEASTGMSVVLGTDYQVTGPRKFNLKYLSPGSPYGGVANSIGVMSDAVGTSLWVEAALPATLTTKTGILQSNIVLQGSDLPGSSFIPLSGRFAGTLVCQFSPDQANPSIVERLAPGVRYSLPDPSDPGKTVSLGATILTNGGGSVVFVLDPLAPLVSTRTFFVLASQTEASRPCGSTLQTTTGEAAVLSPVPPQSTDAAAVIGASRLVFCESLAADGSSTCHLTPDGRFDLSFAGASQPSGSDTLNRLSVGLSGSEFVAVPANDAIALFEAGSPAFVEGGKLTTRTTTAYVTFLPSSGTAGALAYCAQSPDAPLFTTATGNAFESLSLAVAQLPANDTPAPATFPLFPFAGTLPQTSAAKLRHLEEAVLAPERHRIVVSTSPGAGALPAATKKRDAPPPTFAVTPSGTYFTLAKQGTELDKLVVGKVGTAEISFSPLSEGFRAAILSPAPFFVISNKAELDKAKDSLLSLDLDDWKIDFKTAWRSDSAAPTMLLFKYGGRALKDLVADTAAWGWPEAATSPALSLDGTQAAIQNLFEAAARRAAVAGPDDPFARFHDEVVTDPDWTGMLVLNAPATLPSKGLNFLTAGLDRTKFYAHHIGFPLTSLDTGQTPPKPRSSDVFGLIAYEDPEDLSPSSTATVPVAFKVMQLTAAFAKSKMIGLTARVELMLNRLFESDLTMVDPQRGNNLIMSATAHEAGDLGGAYAFHLEQTNTYDVSGSALSSIEISSARLHRATTTGDAVKTTTACFELSGRLRFADFEDFDLFSYGSASGSDGYLAFRGLMVSMTFKEATPQDKAFAIDASGLAFDLGASVARPLSLAANFPLRLSGFLCAPKPEAPPTGQQVQPAPKGQTPESLGYVSVMAPLDQVPLAAPWYGLVFTLDLGSHGALAAQSLITVSVLAGWTGGAPGGDHPPVFLGIRLPDAKDTGVEWPMQGVFRLGFRDFRFDASTAADGKSRAYALRLHKLALSVLGWSFPQGNMDAVLFGEPGGTGSGALGWYAAYEADGNATNAAV